MAKKLVKDSQGLAKDLVNDCISRQAAITQLSHNKNKGDNEYKKPFCPNCGADMRGEQAERRVRMNEV